MISLGPNRYYKLVDDELKETPAESLFLSDVCLKVREHGHFDDVIVEFFIVTKPVNSPTMIAALDIGLEVIDKAVGVDAKQMIHNVLYSEARLRWLDDNVRYVESLL